MRDHGVGIPPEQQDRVFDRFERVSQGRQVSGFGVGLWIVRRIVEAHGGRIQLDSQPGVGASFRVDLPITA